MSVIDFKKKHANLEWFTAISAFVTYWQKLGMNSEHTKWFSIIKTRFRNCVLKSVISISQQFLCCWLLIGLWALENIFLGHSSGTNHHITSCKFFFLHEMNNQFLFENTRGFVNLRNLFKLCLCMVCGASNLIMISSHSSVLCFALRSDALILFYFLDSFFKQPLIKRV